MKLKKLVTVMQSIEKNRQLPMETVIEALKEGLEKAFYKHVGILDAKVKVDINEKKGEIHVYQQRLVVENVEDDELEISLTDAKNIDQKFELGDLVDEELDIQEFGRAAVIMAKNVMKQKIREAEKAAVYEEYCDKVQEMVQGTIETVEEKFVLVKLDKTLATLPRGQQIPNEHYVENQLIRVVIHEVNKESKGAQVLVSRADATLVKRLFEKEVPEIFDGTVEIKAIAREAGERTKMAVYSHDPNVDPIGACIGPKGQRVQVVIDELKGEKIDIFEWSDDITELIKNALAPAEVLAVIDNPKKPGLLVVVADNQLSLAIGKKGKNARLAYKLTGSRIDIKPESDLNAEGLPWKELAIKKHEEYLAKKAAKEVVVEEEVQDVVEDIVATDEAVIEDVVKEQDDMEEAARIAKEKRQSRELDLSEKQEYVSKFEELAGASKKVEEKVVKNTNKTSEKVESKPQEKIKSSLETNRIIYSEEELEEIQRREEEEDAKSWIYDDVDEYEEYDSLYDEMD